MAERLYYTDSYLKTFTAQVIERTEVNGHPAVVLDRTAFYPTSGGQPHDTGALNQIAVIDAAAREEDGAVLHILSEGIEAGWVEGHIDWERRFDHMQHHTGQHILTQAFVQVTGAQTTSFHLSPDSVTIDLDIPEIPLDTLAEAERLANQVVMENRTVTAQVVTPDSAEGVRIRRMPGQLHTAGLRVIIIEGFDATACGGTHVAHTGEIGLIKVLKTEKRGEETRVEFRCGKRALRDYAEKHAIIQQLAGDLTCGYREIGPALDRLRGELKDTQRVLRATSKQLIELEAAQLLQGAALRGQVRVIKAVYSERDAGDLRALASRLTSEPGVMVLLASASGAAQVIMARHVDLPYDMNQALKRLLALLGSERGGGRPDFSQGGGMPASAEALQAALDAAELDLLGNSGLQGNRL